MDAGVLLLHGLFEHKGRHQINFDWFENLGISPHLIDPVSYTHLTLPTKA